MPRPTRGPDGKPIRSFRDADAWETWLEQTHDSSTGLWLRLAKKASRHITVGYAEAVEVALCYGWIDGQARREDDDFSLQKFTPRAKRSMWSKTNRERVQALIDAGRMRPPGLKEIERAKADGRWDAAYDSARTIEVPTDLTAALKKNATARKAFGELDGRNRYAILYQIQTARTAQTRTRRIEKYLAMLGRGEKPYP